MRITYCVPLGLLLILVVAAARPATCAPLPVDQERWYVVLIAETPVGAAHETIATADGRTVTVQRMDITLNRLGTSVTMGTVIETREDGRGRLLGVDQELKVSSQATHLAAVIEPGRVRILDRAGDGEFSREIEYQGELLGPSGVLELVRERLRDVGDRVSYQTFRAELASVASVTLEVVGHEPLTRDGEEVPTRKLEETLSGTALKTTVWVDDEGRQLRSAVTGPFGVMEVVGTDEATARLALAGGELPGDSYAATLAPTQVRVREPRAAARVVLELRHRNPDLGWPEMTSGHQRILESSPERLVLEVRRPEPSGSTVYPVEPTEPIRQYLEPNAYLQSDDPEMRELARSIAGASGDTLEAGLKLERWVAENMSFDMGVVMAPSNEVLDNRRGTCTEYAVLLTTLARSLEIPARLVMGFVYAGGIYGGHAWTEILIGDEWVALDGALVSEGPADAARFAFQWTSLAEGIGALNLGPGVQLFGQIDLSVLEVERADGTVERFDSVAPLFTLDGDAYVNESLGLEWRKPPEFEFADLEITWPETGLVRLNGPEGRRVELAVRDSYYWQDADDAARRALRRDLPGAEAVASSLITGALQAVGERRAALAWIRGTELWMLSVESPTPGGDLERFAAALSF